MLCLLEATLAGIGYVNSHLLQPSGLPPFVISCVFLYLHIVLLAGALVSIELLLPGSKSPKRYGQAALFWACYVPVAVGTAALAHAIVDYFHVTPLFSLRLDSTQLLGFGGFAANAGAIFLSALLLDFFFYWFHRLQHTWGFLWVFHSVHHSNRSLNVLGCYHHPFEDLWRVPFFLLPMALTFEVVAPPLILVSAFVAAWGIFNHMDSSFSLGRFRLVLADNHYHRLHHSLAREHINANFAGMFSVWDKLFMTQRMPQEGTERLPVGLEDIEHPRSLRQYLAGPFVLIARVNQRMKATASRAK